MSQCLSRVSCELHGLLSDENKNGTGRQFGAVTLFSKITLTHITGFLFRMKCFEAANSEADPVLNN